MATPSKPDACGIMTMLWELRGSTSMPALLASTYDIHNRSREGTPETSEGAEKGIPDNRSATEKHDHDDNHESQINAGLDEETGEKGG